MYVSAQLTSTEPQLKFGAIIITIVNIMIILMTNVITPITIILIMVTFIIITIIIRKWLYRPPCTPTGYIDPRGVIKLDILDIATPGSPIICSFPTPTLARPTPLKILIRV